MQVEQLEKRSEKLANLAIETERDHGLRRTLKIGTCTLKIRVSLAIETERDRGRGEDEYKTQSADTRLL